MPPNTFKAQVLMPPRKAGSLEAGTLSPHIPRHRKHQFVGEGRWTGNYVGEEKLMHDWIEMRSGKRHYHHLLETPKPPKKAGVLTEASDGGHDSCQSCFSCSRNCSGGSERLGSDYGGGSSYSKGSRCSRCSRCSQSGWTQLQLQGTASVPTLGVASQPPSEQLHRPNSGAERPRSVGAIARRPVRHLPRSVLAHVDPEKVAAALSGDADSLASTTLPRRPKGAQYLPFAHRPRQWQALLGLQPEDESQPS